MSAPVNTASKVAGELGISVADQEPELFGLVAEVHEQVAGLLGDPGAGGVGGDPGDVHLAGGVLDHDEHVEAAQEDGVARLAAISESQVDAVVRAINAALAAGGITGEAADAARRVAARELGFSTGVGGDGWLPQSRCGPADRRG